MIATFCSCGDNQLTAEDPWKTGNLFEPHINRRTGQPCPGLKMSRKEVNMDEVYREMSAAIKRRDHAVNMLKRWEQIVADSDQRITKLSSMLVTAEQVPEAVTNSDADRVFDELVADTQSYEQA